MSFLHSSPGRSLAKGSGDVADHLQMPGCHPGRMKFVFPYPDPHDKLAVVDYPLVDILDLS